MLPNQIISKGEKVPTDLEKLQVQMDTWIKRYIDEVDTSYTYEELIERYDILPLYDKERKQTLGIFGHQIGFLSKLGVIGTVNLIYVDEKYRDNFGERLKTIVSFMKGMGCNKVEFCLNPKTNRYFEKVLDQEPSTYNYITDPDEILDKLER